MFIFKHLLAKLCHPDLHSKTLILLSCPNRKLLLSKIKTAIRLTLSSKSLIMIPMLCSSF